MSAKKGTNQQSTKNFVTETTTLRNVELLGGQFRNFSGRKTKFNNAGSREFSIRLDTHPEQLKRMQELGYVIKYLKSRDEGEPDLPFITVRISCPGDNPDINPKYLSNVFIVTKENDKINATPQDNKTIGLIDGAEIVKCDLTIRPRNWVMPNGTSGIKPYVLEMYIWVQEKELEKEYRNI